MKSKLENKIVNTLVTVIMMLVVLISLYPLWYALINAFNDANDIADNGFIYIFTRVFTLKNISLVFEEKTLLYAFGITTARTVLGTALTVAFTAIVSYPLSRGYLVGRKVYMRIGVMTMYFYGGLIPTFLVYNQLRLIDTFWVYIFPTMFSFFNAVIFINFFNSIPTALEEAAKIDGADDWKVFWKIMMPLSKPVVATIALFAGVNQWNSWFDSAYFTTSPNLATLQQILYGIISQSQGAVIAAQKLGASKINLNLIDAIKYATMVVSILPIACIYPFLQKYFVGGMMIGAVKE